jgi:RNA polymerase sigma factor (sigma-70 family)
LTHAGLPLAQKANSFSSYSFLLFWKIRWRICFRASSEAKDRTRRIQASMSDFKLNRGNRSLLSKNLFGFVLRRVFTTKTMTDSRRLLADYVENGSETAFRELVTCYIDLVYSSAVRLVNGDTHLAEDVAQTVFIDLARQARTFSEDVLLGGWLHRHTCFVAGKIARGERRRQSRERQAVEMNGLHNHSEENLAQIAPILDEAINQLGAEDRTAILLRFFEQRDFHSVGEALGSSEDAARMRVTRALDKLHTLLKHRGVAFSAVALGTALASQAVTAAPAGLAAGIAASALAGAAAGTGTTLTLLKFMTMTKLQVGIISAIVVASAATPLVVQQHQAQVKLREQNESLQQKVGLLTQEIADSKRRSTRFPAPRLPAPPIAVTSPPAASPTNDLLFTNAFTRSRNGDLPEVTSEQLAHYLAQNRRSAPSLLAAFYATRDKAFLQEAMEKYPNDPQVDFAALSEPKGSSPEERRQWLDAFKQSAPDNPLANYFSASEYFKSGQTDQAVQELLAASGKPVFQDYWLDREMNTQEANLAAGLSQAQAMAAGMSMRVPEFLEMRQLYQNLAGLANSYQQAGDQASAQAVLQMGLNLGQSLDQPTGQYSLAEYAMGMDIENQILALMDPNSPYGTSGQTVKNQLDAIVERRAALKALTEQANVLLPTLSDQELAHYIDRAMVFGGLQAMQSLVNNYGQQGTQTQ